MASYAALWFLVAFLTLVAIGLLREVTVLRRSMVGAGLRGDAPLVIGSRAPNFSAMDARSGKKTSEMLNGLVSLVAFVSPHCSICRLLMDNFKSVLGRGAFALVTVCKGNENDCRSLLDRLGPEAPLLLDAQGEISELYGVSSYPVVVVVDQDRRVRGYGYPRHIRDLEEFVANALREIDPRGSAFQSATK